MSEENVEVVRRIYAAWLEGRSARDLIDADVEYVKPAGCRRGRHSARAPGLRGDSRRL
jgi:ketosteroid isomerase-like protein